AGGRESAGGGAGGGAAPPANSPKPVGESSSLAGAAAVAASRRRGRRHADRLHRADESAERATDAVVRPGQPGERSAHFQTIGRAKLDAVAAAGAAGFIQKRQLGHGYSSS